MNWTINFLDQRVIRVVVDGFTSEPHTITVEVAQGSVLSPTLCLIYINDLLETTNNPTSQMTVIYMDHTVIPENEVRFKSMTNEIVYLKALMQISSK